MTDEPMKRSPWNSVGWSLAAFVLLAALYGGLYLAMLVDDESSWVEERLSNRLVSTRRVARYRVEGEVVSTIFRPAQMIDEMIRPSHWSKGFTATLF